MTGYDLESAKSNGIDSEPQSNALFRGCYGSWALTHQLQLNSVYYHILYSILSFPKRAGNVTRPGLDFDVPPMRVNT